MSGARWDKVYGDFDYSRFSVWKETSNPYFVSKIPHLREKGVHTILDAGCGDGRNLLAFASAGFQVTGIDASQEACKLAQRVCTIFPDTTIINMPLEDLHSFNEMDTIVCDYVMVHLNKPEIILNNLFNALKPGGYLLIEFLSTDDPHAVSLSDNNYISYENKIYHHYYTLEESIGLLNKFHVIEHIKSRHEDPEHVPDYPRSHSHFHDSLYFFCQKPM